MQFLRPVRQGIVARQGWTRGLKSTPYTELSIGVPKELTALERRVAQTPESVGKLVKEGFTVRVEAGAGKLADFSDAAYTQAGASIVSREEAFSSSLVTMVNVPTKDEAAMVKDRMLLSFIWPGQNPELMEQFKSQGTTAFAMDCIPRVLSRGQAFDALSSQVRPHLLCLRLLLDRSDVTHRRLWL